MMKYGTKNDYVYKALKQDIARGNFLEGERLIINDLARKYNVSAAPIREAISRLMQDGLVETIPHIGSRVTRYDLVKYEEIQQVRLEMECLATRLLAPNITDADIKMLEKLLEEGARCQLEQTVYKYGDWNRKFHLTISSLNPNKTLHEYIVSIWDKMEHVLRGFHRTRERDQKSLEEHIAWVEALKTRDAILAEKTFREHGEAVIKYSYNGLIE